MFDDANLKRISESYKDFLYIFKSFKYFPSVLKYFKYKFLIFYPFSPKKSVPADPHGQTGTCLNGNQINAFVSDTYRPRASRPSYKGS